MAVFRNYSLPELQKQYDARLREPELAEVRLHHAQRLLVEANTVRSRMPAVLDRRYGPHPRELIDVFPARQANAPLMAFIHGGYWMQGDKAEYAWMAPAFAARGIAFASIGYPLCPEVGIGSIVASVRQALLLLADDASSFGVDPACIHISGHSAGGHLAAMLISADAEDRADASVPIAGAVLVSGLYDLEPLRLAKPELAIDETDVDRVSPMRLSPRKGACILLAVGENEGAEFKRHTDELEQSWGEHPISMSRMDARGRYHFDVLEDFARPGQPIFERVAATITEQDPAAREDRP